MKTIASFASSATTDQKKEELNQTSTSNKEATNPEEDSFAALESANFKLFSSDIDSDKPSVPSSKDVPDPNNYTTSKDLNSNTILLCPTTSDHCNPPDHNFNLFKHKHRCVKL